MSVEKESVFSKARASSLSCTSKEVYRAVMNIFFAFAVSALWIGVYGMAPTLRKPATNNVLKLTAPANVFDRAVHDWAKKYPVAYKNGWGPTTKAERWNGRHAMFGWVALLATGYAKSHGLIPSGDSFLDVKEWGTLAYVYGGSISTERAVILIGHFHLLMISICAAVAPLSFQDKLYVEDDEEPEPASGLLPKLKAGLTMEAEMLNGRLAMLGLTILVLFSAVNSMPILDVINAGLGGLLM